MEKVHMITILTNEMGASEMGFDARDKKSYT